MKSTKILIAAVAMMTVLFSGCEKEVFTGIDTSKACVEDFNYDDVNSSSNAVAFYWDATKAIKDGATSFSVQLAKEADFRDIDMYDATIGKTVQVSSSLNDAVIFTGLKEYDRYYARVRANYARSIFSDWTILKVDGELACVSVGHGLVVMTFCAPTELNLEAPSYNKVIASWNVIGAAAGYIAEYKKGTDSGWTQFYKGDKASAEITGLAETTAYDVRVKAYRTVDGAEEFSEYITKSITTPAKPDFDPQIKTAAQLAEFIADIAAVSGSTDTYTLENDIDMTGVSIPASASTFAGVFDGKNHSIKNYSATVPLFAEVAESATVKNIIFDASCTTAPESQEFAFIALNNKGKVEACTNKAPVAINASGSITGVVALASLVTYNFGTVTGCINEGAVSFTVNGTSEAWGVAGVVAYSEGTVQNCTNKGKVSCSAERCTEKLAFLNCNGKVTGCLGGVVCYAGPGMKVIGCTNEGALDYNVTKINEAGANINRNQIGGVVAAPAGEITDCTNKGNITVNCVCVEGKTAGKEYIVGVAGISGGDYFATNNNLTNITNCVNEGAINVTFDASASNSTVGGIVAWPGVESADQTNLIKDCTNKGNITISGNGKGRFGGVAGGSGNLVGCKNYGTITNNTKVSGSCVGGVSGYRNNTLKIENCESYGDVVNTNGDLVYTGGLIGAWGGADFNSGAGCIVKCNVVVTAADETKANNYSGMIIGRFNGDKKDTLGSSEKPISVSGSISINSTKTDITADNYTQYCAGKERTLSVNASDPTCNRQIYAKFE